MCSTICRQVHTSKSYCTIVCPITIDLMFRAGGHCVGVAELRYQHVKDVQNIRKMMSPNMDLITQYVFPQTLCAADHEFVPVTTGSSQT